MSPQQVHPAAGLKFGSIATAREESREAWGFVWLETLWQDVRLGVRVLARRRWTTALVCFLLAAGIGLNTMIFTIVNGALYSERPYEDDERILYLESRPCCDCSDRGHRPTRWQQRYRRGAHGSPGDTGRSFFKGLASHPYPYRAGKLQRGTYPVGPGPTGYNFFRGQQPPSQDADNFRCREPERRAHGR
jgi:hypothetical protein